MSAWENIFIINMRKDAKRREHISNELEKYNIQHYKFFEAVDGKLLMKETDSLELLNSPMNPGQIGCYMSHLQIYEKIVSDNLSGAVIFEDDITTTPWTPEIPNFLKQLPRGWDIVWIGNSRALYPRNTCSIIPNPKYAQEGVQQVSKNIFQLIDTKHTSHPMGLYAYAISNKAARDILSLEKHYEIPIDNVIINQNWKKYMMIPSAIVHCFNFGTNTTKQGIVSMHNKNIVNPYQNIWLSYPETEKQIFEILSNLTDVLKKYSINYTLAFQTLLGYQRHNTRLVPWEDKVELAIDVGDITKFEDIDELKGQILSYTSENNSYRIHSVKNSLEEEEAEEEEGLWPYVYVHIYEMSGKDIVFQDESGNQFAVPRKNLKLTQDFIYPYNNPSHQLPVQLFSPPEIILDELYPNWEYSCESSKYSHIRGMKTKDRLNIPCEYIDSELETPIWFIFYTDDTTDIKSLNFVLDTLDIYDFKAIFISNGNPIEGVTERGHSIVTKYPQISQGKLMYIPNDIYTDNLAQRYTEKGKYVLENRYIKFLSSSSTPTEASRLLSKKIIFIPVTEDIIVNLENIISTVLTAGYKLNTEPNIPSIFFKPKRLAGAELFEHPYSGIKQRKYIFWVIFVVIVVVIILLLVLLWRKVNKRK